MIVSSSRKSSGGCPQCGQIRGESHWLARRSSIGTSAKRAFGSRGAERSALHDEIDPLALAMRHAAGIIKAPFGGGQKTADRAWQRALYVDNEVRTPTSR